MDTRAGEIISSSLAIGTSVSVLTSPVDTRVIQTLYDAGALPEWAIIATLCGIFCLLAVFFQANNKIQALARFMSGCLWGTILLALAANWQLFPLFWTALVLFVFDLFVIIKGQTWTRRSNC